MTPEEIESTIAEFVDRRGRQDFIDYLARELSRREIAFVCRYYLDRNTYFQYGL